ncbi:mRNA (2'-O-methyladenosine-N(6)-)-methyltransferase [Aureococcus anophagefferens]|uniref:mRNA (2'-O-methyladenosine-N(6)-)-methyltransferase n=1 Tax=Aureococcus anophagefferens TaxID=44056 RepID=A0ABR1FS48_AURAN
MLGVLICDGDASHEAHLACAGIDARPGFEWRCDRCAPASIYVEEDATSPWVSLEAHARVRAVVDNLRQEFYGVVSAGQNVWVGERSWDQRGPFALSDRDAAEIYGKVVFWEGADADLSARAGGDFADLEVSAPEDWLRKPSSISLFPSGRCGATRAYLAAEISKRVEDRSTRVDALRSGDAALSASDSARLIVDKWLRFCDAAAERVDARRREVTAALRATLCGDELVAYPDWAPQARPGAVAEVYCAKNASVRCKLRVDVLRRLLDRFLAAKLGSARAVPAATLDDANDEAEAALAARPGRIPKRKRPQARGDGDDERPPAFLSKVFSMLLRYDDLAGDAGQHGAIPAAVFDVLRRWGCDAECCATPFNATLGSYCSPFRDTDAPFGSVGSFFAFEPASGCYEINPPFTLNSDVVERHLRTLLDAAERGGRPLMFVMVHAAAHARHARDGATRALPARDGPCARYLRRDFLLAAGAHHYREGKFYARALPRAYVPPMPSIVLFLATDAGARRWPATRELQAGIEDAFAWPLRRPPGGAEAPGGRVQL